MLGVLERFFGTWRFAVSSLAALLALEVLLAAMVVWPADVTALGAFASEFRVWCFGLDPETGEMDPWQLALFGFEPLGLAAIVLVIWGRTLREAPPRQWVPWAMAGFGAVGLSTAAMATTVPAQSDAKLPFPADDLRTALPFPPLGLVDQGGAAPELAGRVVLVTAAYARCGRTCPMVLAQARAAVDALDPTLRADLRVLAITLDPAHDTPDTLAGWAASQGLGSPPWHLLGGPVPDVEAALDRLGFARVRDPTTGVIDHANLFLLVDRRGRLAYRFSLGARQARWLDAALRILLAE